MLETLNPTAKHARWWVKVYGQGVRKLKINYRPDKNADALSRRPHKPAQLAIAEDDGEVQISLISEFLEQTIESLLEAGDIILSPSQLHWGRSRGRGRKLKEITDFLEKGDLPMQGPLFVLVDWVLYFMDSRQGGRKCAVLLRQFH